MLGLESLLRDMEQAGITVSLHADGKNLELKFAQDPPDDLLVAIKKAKPSLKLWLLSQTDGHCGPCRRFTRREDFGSWMGECSAGRRRHGWLDGNPDAPVEIHMSHRCCAYGGTGYQRR